MEKCERREKQKNARTPEGAPQAILRKDGGKDLGIEKTEAGNWKLRK